MMILVSSKQSKWCLGGDFIMLPIGMPIDSTTFTLLHVCFWLYPVICVIQFSDARFERQNQSLHLLCNPMRSKVTKIWERGVCCCWFSGFVLSFWCRDAHAGRQQGGLISAPDTPVQLQCMLLQSVVPVVEPEMVAFYQ